MKEYEVIKESKLSIYGVPMKDTCHKGKECGIQNVHNLTT